MPVRCHIMSCKSTVVQRIKSYIGSYMSDCLMPLCGVWWSHSAMWDKHCLNCLLISYIYIYIIPLWQPEGNHYITWDEYLMIFDYLIRRTPHFVADEYRRERIYFRYWGHCLFHWASCKYLLHICLLFCFISSCKRYKHMHSYLWHCKYIQYVTIIPPLPHGLLESFKIVNNDFTFDSITLFPCGPSPSLVFSIIHFFTMAAIDL